MKYLSLVAVIIFISFTWWFSQQTRDLSVQQIHKMNNLIAQYMTQKVQGKQPLAENIDFSSIHTEIIERGKKMRAHFKFSYMEPNKDGQMEKVYRKGSFIITSEDGDKWTAQIDEVGDVQVEFLEPFNIKAGDDTGLPTEDTEQTNDDGDNSPEKE